MSENGTAEAVAEAPGGTGSELREIGRALEGESRKLWDPGDEEPASLADVQVTRKDGELQPIRVRTLFEGAVIEFLPITWGDRKRFPLRDKGVEQFTDEERLELVRAKLVRPDLSELSLEEIAETVDWNFIDDCATAIVANSRFRLRRQLPEIRETDLGKAEGDAGETPPGS